MAEKEPDVKKDSFKSTIRNLAEMGLSGEMADLTVVVEGKEFPCHRLYLSAASPYFRAMFNSGMSESQKGRVELHEVSKKIFEIIRTFIYTGNIETEKITLDNVCEILHATALYELQPMQEECENILGKEINNENCLNLFKLSRLYNCKVLFDKCRPYIMEGFNGIWKSNEFTTLHEEDLRSIVRDDELVPVDEEQICEAILMWVGADKEERQKHIGKLFQHIRFINISPEYLVTELYSQNILTRDEDCRRYLDEARDFHMLPARQHEFSSKRFHLRNSDDYEEVILVLTEFDMARSGSFYQDGKCLWAFSLQQNRWFTLSPVPHQQNPGLDVGMVSYRTDVFISGGNDQKSSKNILKYDSEKNEFALVTDAALKKGRFKHVMVAIRESLYVMGGLIEKSNKDGSHSIIATIEEMHVHGKRWRTVGELKTAVHSAPTSVVGEKVFLFGGILEDGMYHDKVQVFNVRNRETEEACTLDKTMSQPFKVLNFDRKTIVFTSKGEMYDFNTGTYEFKLMKKLAPSFLPIAACSHYKERIILLTGTAEYPNVYSKMWQMDMRVNPFKIDLIIPKSSIKPKPIHACQRGRVNKQFMYHTYFQ